MALVTLAGADLLEGEVHLPPFGPWFAHLKIDDPSIAPGPATLAAANGLSLAGYITEVGEFLGASHAHMVGGAGGLATQVSGAWRQAQLRDPVQAVVAAAGEKLSSTVDASLLDTPLAYWSLFRKGAALALAELCGAASRLVGQAIGWRFLADGTLWLGVESWPAASLPEGADVLLVHPEEGRYVIGCDTPSLLPGVDLAGVGHVLAVDHFLEADKVRTWAWV